MAKVINPSSVDSNQVIDGNPYSIPAGSSLNGVSNAVALRLKKAHSFLQLAEDDKVELPELKVEEFLAPEPKVEEKVELPKEEPKPKKVKSKK